MSETVFAADPTRLLIAALVRASVGAAVVAMTMAAGIMASMPAVAGLSPLYLAAMVCAITGGATAFSHVNDSGFWLVSSLLEIDEKTTLKSWTMMETIIGFTGLIYLCPDYQHICLGGKNDCESNIGNHDKCTETGQHCRANFL